MRLDNTKIIDFQRSINQLIYTLKRMPEIPFISTIIITMITTLSSQAYMECG